MSVGMLGMEEGDRSGYVSACQQFGEVGRMASVRTTAITFCRERLVQVSAKRDPILEKLK